MSDSLKIDASEPTVTGQSAAARSDAIEERSALTLTPPAPVTAVSPTDAAQAVSLEPATVAKLDSMIGAYLDAIATLDVHDPTFANRVNDIRTLGDDDIKASAAVSSRLLDRPVAAMKRGGLSGGSSVSTSLTQLRHTVEELDPARQGDLLSRHKLLGILPFGDRLRRYFDKYTSSQSHINAIIKALYHGQDELRTDNASIEQEKVKLWQVMERLRQYIYLGQKLDAGLSARIAQIEATDPERARVLSEDVLFYARQKVQDLTTQLAVSVQGYLTLDVVRKNNLELIKGVDRATTTTVSALRTAVIAAQALGDQKLVLDQVTALNSTTSSIIESTSTLLRQQSAAINEQAGTSTVELEKLQNAFANIYATLDEMDSFRLKALDNMSTTIDTLSTEISKAQTYVERAREERPAASTSDSSGFGSLG